jgi:hypothetical protein
MPQRARTRTWHVRLLSARDELSFFPLIYWPIVPSAQHPSQEALTRIDAYMKQGGTVLFDTRDALMAPHIGQHEHFRLGRLSPYLARCIERMYDSKGKTEHRNVWLVRER